MSGADDKLLVGQAASPAAGDLCGCCAGLTHATPIGVFNRPGLPAISYRIGTHSRFLSSMLADLSSARLPALADLQSRDTDDFTIALLDAWASVADVLTFYQERIANESYLRTATERLSVVELARLIGYRPQPGMAASTYLAFNLEAAPGAPDQAVAQTTIPRGSKVQSVPGPDEKAQIFETSQDLAGRVAWNALRPRLSIAKKPVFGDTETYLAGTATNLRPGDTLLLVGDEREADPVDNHWDFRRLTAVEPDHDHDRTRVAWAEPLGSTTPSMQPPAQPRVFALRLRASLFGYNAPHPRSLHPTILTQYGISGATPGDWAFTISGQTLDLDAVYAAVTRGSWLLLSKPTYQELYRVDTVSEGALALYAISGKTTRVVLDTANNLDLFDGGDYRGTAVFTASEQLAFTETPIDLPVWGDNIVIDQAIEGLEEGRKLILRGKLARLRVAVAGLKLTAVDDPAATITVIRGDVLALLQAPEDAPGSPGQQNWQLQDAGGIAYQVVTPATSFVYVAAAKEDEVIAEIVTLTRIDAEDELHSRLVLSTPLAHAYDRGSLEILANVVAANHGESVSEILGSGQASTPFQQFQLKQTPLTYVSSPAGSGIASSLELRVDDVLWHEQRSLYGQGPRDRVYATAMADDGTVSVQFGDGKQGARLPSGQDNIRAAYRKGIGLAGNVKARQLTTLLSRPLGLKDAVNPLPASGGADPDTLATARENAPITVLTLDRAVSLRDYEDFVRNFGGGAVAKAMASWFWDGGTRRVLVTVSGPEGAPIPDDSILYENIVAALKAAGDPFVEFRIKSYRPAYFRLALKVKIDPDYVAKTVLAEVEAALRRDFSFAPRGFGQVVSLSEVIAAAQNVAGVIALDIDKLYRATPPASPTFLETRLPATPPSLAAEGSLLAAELLTLDAGPFDHLDVMP